MRINGHNNYYRSLINNHRCERPTPNQSETIAAKTQPSPRGKLNTQPAADVNVNLNEVYQKLGEDKNMINKQDHVSQQHFGISQKQAKDERNKLKILITCLEISRRIISGDNVPYKDHKFLMDHDPTLYFKSISMRIPKENPYDYKRLSKDDKDNIQVDGTNIKKSLSIINATNSDLSGLEVPDSNLDITI